MSQSDTHNESTNAFASTVLRIAADVERDEAALRDRVAALICIGDGARAQRLLEQWKSLPAADVLRLDATNQLD